jgi:hypothetical protein
MILMLAGVVGVKADENYSNQLWFNVTLGYPKNEKLLLELDFQPKVQVNGDIPWHNFNATGLVEYYPNDWIDLTGELTLGGSNLLADLNSFELTPRVGLRIHIFSTIKDAHTQERTPSQRIGISNLARLEVRSFSYSDDRASNQELRFRNRFEFRIPINRQLMNIDRTLYLLSDLEAFFPISGKIAERFSTKLLFRFGLGYRISYNWRAELLYIGEKSRETLGEEFDVTSESFNFRVKYNF